MTDPTRLPAYKDALGNWGYEGYVRFELVETAYQWVRRELDNVTLKRIAQLMHEYVEAGGEIDEVRETRPEWSGEYAFHYDLRFTIQERSVYIETRLNFRLPLVPDESTILVVNIHER